MTMIKTPISAITRSATDACADHLRDAIISGQFGDDGPLVIDRLAVDLGVSPTPIREALRRLEAEGFVVHEARRGVTVRPIDAREFEELVDIRKALESLVLRVSVDTAGAAAFRPAKAALDAWGRTSTPDETMTAQWRFFRALYVPSGKTRILELISANWKHIHRYHLMSWVVSPEFRATDADLKGRLLARCEEGDTAGAIRALEASIEWGKSLVVRKMSSLDEEK